MALDASTKEGVDFCRAHRCGTGVCECVFGSAGRARVPVDWPGTGWGGLAEISSKRITDYGSLAY